MDKNNASIVGPERYWAAAALVVVHFAISILIAFVAASLVVTAFVIWSIAFHLPHPLWSLP